MRWACRLAPLALASFAFCVNAEAGDTDGARTAPLSIPHTLNLELDAKARKRHADTNATLVVGNTEGFTPLTWPRNTDIRARLLSTDLSRTPVFGWMAASLYRSRKEPGWCVEVDPGGNEYLIQYRLVLK